MIIECPDCQRSFEDEYRSHLCPHETFAHHPESYLGHADGGKSIGPDAFTYPRAYLFDPSDTKRQYPILVVCALIVRDGCVLLERHAPNGKDSTIHLWDIPGGKVEIGETPEQAVVREIREEMGVEIEAVRLLPRLDVSVCNEKHWVLATYECQILSGEPVLGEDLQWFPISLLEQAEVKTPDFEIIKEYWR